MNITRSNFSQALPLIYDCIKRCDYFAFDFEFTGVKASELLINSALEPVFFSENLLKTLFIRKRLSFDIGKSSIISSISLQYSWVYAAFVYMMKKG